MPSVPPRVAAASATVTAFASVSVSAFAPTAARSPNPPGRVCPPRAASRASAATVGSGEGAFSGPGVPAV